MELLSTYPEIPWYGKEYATAPTANLKLPDGARIGVLIHTAFEAWSELSHPAITHFRSAQTEFSPIQTAEEYDFNSASMHDYGGRCGIYRVLDLYAKHGINGTFATCGLAAERYPDAVRAIADAGHEIAAHSWAQDIRHSIMTEEVQQQDIDRTIDALVAAGAPRPKGWISPGGSSTRNLLRNLVDRGFTWTGDPKNDDDPFIIPTDPGRIVAVGSRGGRTGINDIEIMRGGQPRDLLQRFRDEFDWMYEEAERRPRLIYAVMHAEVQTPSVTKVYDEMIKYVKGFPGVWFTTRGEVAEIALSNTPEAA